MLSAVSLRRLLGSRHLPQLRDRCCPNTRVVFKSPAIASALRQSLRPRTRLVRPSNFSIPPSLFTNTMTAEKSKVLIFGAGNFGSCLADHLGDSSHEVLLWSRIPEQVEYFNKHHRNPEVLQEHVFPDCIKAIGPDFPTSELVQSMDVLLIALPTQAIRYVRSPPGYTSLLTLEHEGRTLLI